MFKSSLGWGGGRGGGGGGNMKGWEGRKWRTKKKKDTRELEIGGLEGHHSMSLLPRPPFLLHLVTPFIHSTSCKCTLGNFPPPPPTHTHTPAVSRQSDCVKETLPQQPHQGRTLKGEGAHQGRTLKQEGAHQGRTLKQEGAHQGRTLKQEGAHQGRTLKQEGAHQGRTSESLKGEGACASSSMQCRPLPSDVALASHSSPFHPTRCLEC